MGKSAGEVCGELCRELGAFLGDREAASVEAYWIVSEALGKDKAFIMTYPEREIAEPELGRIRAVLAERLTGRPLAYIFGKKEFWSLGLRVDETTLIPRPDTETLVERALLFAAKFEGREGAIRILDLGTGSGAVALALKSELGERAEIDASDYSEGALRVAAYNSARLGLPVNLLNSDWFDAIPPGPRYDMIVSNPPYVAADDPHLRRGDVRFEPRTALVAPMSGLLDILNIVRKAPAFLADGGGLLLEHGFRQGGDVRRLMAEAGFADIETARDLGYNERVTEGTLNRAK